MRIVSLLPSATEIVCALGASSSLVGRSEECDYPETVRALPVVMRAKVHDADRSSAEIDARVRSVRGSGESLYSLDLDLLRTLAPDLLITQDLCSVCSVTVDEVRRAVVSLESEARVLSLSPEPFGGVGQHRGGRAHRPERRRRPRAWPGQLRARAPRRWGAGSPSDVAWPSSSGWTLRSSPGCGPPDASRRPAAWPSDRDPHAPGARSPWEELRALRPDLVILSPCSFTVDGRSGSSRTRASDPASPPSLPRSAFGSRTKRTSAARARGSPMGSNSFGRCCDARSPGEPMPVERWGAGKVRS